MPGGFTVSIFKAQYNLGKVSRQPPFLVPGFQATIVPAPGFQATINPAPGAQ